MDMQIPMTEIRIPRVCGGVPVWPGLPSYGLKYSPRMRGCSGKGPATAGPSEVFPAYAGVFPSPPPSSRRSNRIPRVCGGVPPPMPRPRALAPYSPRMRGCSYKFVLVLAGVHVFPAYAGVFLGS